MASMILATTLLAFLVCAVLHVLAVKDFAKMNLLDFPERYGLTRQRLPYPTGIVAVLTFIAFFCTIAPWTLQTAGIILGILILSIISFIDDRRGIDPRVRLFMQALIAFIIFATGSRIYTLTNPFIVDGIIKLDSIDIPLKFSIFNFQFSMLLPLLSGVFTMFWLLLTMNALNWFDGIPGQVSLLSTIGFIVIGLLSLSTRVNQPELAQISFILAAISVACLLFDFPPNKVLMGDTGAMFFGLMLGVLTLYAGGKVATAFLVLGVPLIDVFLVVTRRLMRRKNPLKGNSTDEHLHHRLLAKEWSERSIIMLTALLGTLFGTIALFASSLQKALLGMILFAVMIALTVYSKPKTPQVEIDFSQ